MRTSTRETSDGFTLVELTLVLLILGIMLSLAVPRLSLIGEAQLDSAARRMAATISYLHDEAALRGRTYKMTLDLDADSYLVDVQAPYAHGEAAEHFAALWDPYAEPSTMPPEVDLVSVETAVSTHTSGTAEVFFAPEMSLGGVTVTLQGDSGRTVELAVDGVTGNVRVSDADPAGRGR